MEIFSMTYQEILMISDESQRLKYLREFLKEVENISNSYPEYEFDYSYSLDDNYSYAESLSDNCSEYLFPGDIVYYYPIVSEKRAIKSYTCSLSGAIIEAGSWYLEYKAFLYNKTRRLAYITNGMKFEINSGFMVPDSLEEFEEFWYRLDHAYELGLVEEYNISTISRVNLRKLNRRKKEN